jgi:hypothetical protein
MRSAAVSAQVAVDGSVAWRSTAVRLELLHRVRSRSSEMYSVRCLSFLKIVASRREQNNEHTI